MLEFSRSILGKLDGSESADSSHEFLPNFCGAGIVLTVMLLALLFSIIVTTLTGPFSTSLLQDFVLVTLFVEWVCLSCVAVLCGLRVYLNSFSPERAMLATFAIILTVTFVISEVSVWLLYAAGKLNTPRPQWYGYFHVQNIIVGGITGALVVRYFSATDQVRRRTLEWASAQQELQRYRIRKHFVYNSMNTIAGLTLKNSEKVETAIEDTADLIREMLDDKRNLVKVNNEVELVEKYLRMESLRLQNRLKVQWLEKSYPFGARTPALILQLLIELAVQYGIEPAPDGGTIAINIGARDNLLEISVEFTTHIGDDAIDVQLENSEIFTNISLQLQTHYSERANLICETGADGIKMTITHPIQGTLTTKLES